jgi:hypothetical protein
MTKHKIFLLSYMSAMMQNAAKIGYTDFGVTSVLTKNVACLIKPFSKGEVENYCPGWNP